MSGADNNPDVPWPLSHSPTLMVGLLFYDPGRLTSGDGSLF
ncbi:uncharacterized protein Asalp_00990 [Aeromonas salmonicida subsp. pectinolytica 34mel]|uniref:Uncharacterized protein n=1 Tax=Aeromonas salmonicida subsp. pectinolytica 34mel TaxID=1324960 RepID=A0A2D1QAV6_AERSA|nr:uncharacterized protein Asalp_00990 [Aeromonas salmonicida subsp. pectinolytica 34mel]